jgi:dihydroorotate dehydrogenase (fumarate)
MKSNLTSDYLGLSLKNPLLASSSPLTGDLDSLKRLEDAGVGGVVLPSLFEEQVEHEELEDQRLNDYGAENSPEVTGYFPELSEYKHGPEEYLDHIRAAKSSLSVPVVASLNGHSPGGWARFSSMMEEAGADALELNVYYVPADPEMTGENVEKRIIQLVEQVRKATQLPLAVKLGPYFSSLPHMATRLDYAGADGLVLFNRYLQPDLDLETMEVVPHLVLSRREEMLLALRWIAILKDQVGLSLCATSGVHDHLDLARMLLVGADAVAVASTLLRKGPAQVREILRGLNLWMEEMEYASVEQLKGSYSQANCPNPEAFERGNYMKALTKYTNDWV